MDDDDFLRIQRELRARLFEGSAAIRWRPGRELAAQLLLYLDDVESCWRLTTEWLRDTLDADRVDGGYGGFLGRNLGHDRNVIEQGRNIVKQQEQAGGHGSLSGKVENLR